MTAQFPDALYKNVEWVDSADAVLARADVLLKVQPPTRGRSRAAQTGAVVIGFLAGAPRPDDVRALRDRGITSFAMELVPRISRAQSMDALSSQAAIAGYKAVLIAREHARQVLPDADDRGRHDPPGAGAGDRRGRRGPAGDRDREAPRRGRRSLRRARATREQIKSLGAKFVETGVSAEGAGGYARELTAEEKAKQQEVLDARIAAADAVITTAAVPGRAAPRIISRGGGRAHEARAR